MALPTNLLDSDWSEEILDAAREMSNGVISILDPGTPGTYDPVTDEETGGTADTVLIDHRAARIQHIRLPQEGDNSGQASSIRRYRFGFEIDPSDPLLTPGLIVRVDDGGRDHTLPLLRYTMVAATNSSHAALRTIEAETAQVPSS